MIKDKKNKTSTRKYLQVDFIIIDGQEKKKSKSSHGRLYYLHKNGFWMEVPSIEINGMHMSFGSSTLTRNSLLLEVHTVNPIDKIKIKGEVEWYELITSGKDYTFNVGISIIELSKEGKKKFNKLVGYFKTHLDLG